MTEGLTLEQLLAAAEECLREVEEERKKHPEMQTETIRCTDCSLNCQGMWLSEDKPDFCDYWDRPFAKVSAEQNLGGNHA